MDRKLPAGEQLSTTVSFYWLGLPGVSGGKFQREGKCKIDFWPSTNFWMVFKDFCLKSDQLTWNLKIIQIHQIEPDNKHISVSINTELQIMN